MNEQTSEQWTDGWMNRKIICQCAVGLCVKLPYSSIGLTFLFAFFVTMSTHISIQPSHHPISPPISVAVTIATSHAFHLVIAAFLRPHQAFCQWGAVALTQSGYRAGELCQKWESCRGRKKVRKGEWRGVLQTS